MLLAHPDHPDRGVRLAYCLNLHPADDFAGSMRGLREITLPLAERLGGPRLREGFGVGMWLPAHVALELTAEEGSPELDELLEFLAQHRLDAFTFNAFPYGGFHREAVKEAVFRPTWKSPERLAYTLSVARIAHAARETREAPIGERDHVSISTHTGMYQAWVQGDEDITACAKNLALCALHLSQMDHESGLRIVLSLEPEPGSLAGSTRSLPGLMERIRVASYEVLGRGDEELRDVCDAICLRHIGTCLDACHAAVEFEEPVDAYRNATASGGALGKLQFSSAVSLRDPARNDVGRDLLFGMAETIYLHQVTGRRSHELIRATDLPELEASWSAPDTPWRDAEEWRCHFHVPVDRATLGEPAARLGTTRAHADALLADVLADPERWGTRELHLELETYTWDVLPGAIRGPGALVDGLEREYRHVLSRLAEAGWSPATDT